MSAFCIPGLLTDSLLYDSVGMGMMPMGGRGGFGQGHFNPAFMQGGGGGGQFGPDGPRKRFKMEDNA